MSRSRSTVGATLALSAMIFAVALSTLCASLPSHDRLDPDTAPRWALAFLSICTIGSEQPAGHESGHEDHGSGHDSDQHCAMCYAICAALVSIIAAATVLLLESKAGNHACPAPITRLRAHDPKFFFQGRAPPRPA